MLMISSSESPNVVKASIEIWDVTPAMQRFLEIEARVVPIHDECAHSMAVKGSMSSFCTPFQRCHMPTARLHSQR
jgi:hypothetical protein